MKPILLVQQKMELPPIPKSEKRYSSFAEAFESVEVSEEWKLNWIGWASRSFTLNNVTRRDLQAAIKWLFEKFYIYE